MTQAFKIIEGPKTVKVTTQMAREFADLPHISRERNFSQARYDKHRKNLEQGRLRPPEWATAVCKEDGIEYRVNGQHTSRMLAEAPPEMVKDVKVTITRFECPTLEDVAILWSTFDPKISVRGARDIYSAFAGMAPELNRIHSGLINAIAAGFGVSQEINKGSSSSNRLGPTERGEKLLQETDFVKWSASILVGDDGTHMRRAPVAAAMYDTWKKSQADARKFWRLVRTGEGKKPTDPDRLLQKFLLTVSIRIDQAPSRAKTAGQREVYARCITAWNAWRKGVSTDLKYFPKAKLPVPA